MGKARNVIIARSADGLIAVGGEYGTLAEIAFALKFQKPVVGLHSWQVDPSVMAADSPERAVNLLLQRLTQPGEQTRGQTEYHAPIRSHFLVYIRIFA